MLKRSVFQRRNNVILINIKTTSKFNVENNDDFWVDTKTNFVVISIIDNRRHFNVYFRYNFDGWKIEGTLLLKNKKSWSLTSFRYFKNESRLAVYLR